MEIWKDIRAMVHDALRYKKAKKKKILSAGNIFAVGIVTMLLMGTASAISADEDWNIPGIDPSNNGATQSSEQISVVANPAAETRLTYNSAYDRQPAWSPDGQWISFVSTRGGTGWDIWKVSKNGESSGLARLTTYGGFDLEPNWNPSSKIVFAAGSGQGYEDVYTMNSDGTGRTRLTTATDFDEYADWNPDGTKIAYSSVGGSPGGAKQIWVMNADGSNKHRINTAYAIQPAWSPDGTKIAFKCYPGGGYGICVMNADGSNLRTLVSEVANTHDPDWTPDSRQIIYASKRDGDWELYLMNADGTNRRQLTNNVGIDEDFPSISRDGLYVVYMSTRSGNQEIWTMPLASVPITTGITVNSPNGGENWSRGSTRTIKWTSSGSPGSYVKIELFKSGVLNRIISSSTPNDGSQGWIVPSTQTVGSDYKIKVTSTTNVAYTDMSNTYFRIY